MLKLKNIYTAGLIALGLLSSCHSSLREESSSLDEPIDCVNPYMGNISHLLVPTFPTVHLPNSMLRFYPNRSSYTDQLIHGLPLVIPSHRGEPALLISPTEQPVADSTRVIDFSYDDEVVRPYCYSVYLDNAGVGVQLAPSHQAAILQLDYDGEEGKQPSLLLDSPNGELQSEGKAVSGYQVLKNDYDKEALPTKVYFYMELSDVPESTDLLDLTAEGKGQRLQLLFPTGKGRIIARYGISYIDVEQAKRNLYREIQTFELDLVVKEGRYKWTKALGKLEVKGGTPEERRVFYTSLYRTYERMVSISEDGRYYNAATGSVEEDGGVPFYTDDWIWDTYRAVHPLRILIDPKGEQAMLQSYLRMAESSKEGWLPTFPEVIGDTHRMNGNHGIATFVDAMAKGLDGIDLQKAYAFAEKTLKEKSYLPWTYMPKGELSEYMDREGYFPGLGIGQRETDPRVTKWEKRQSVAVSLAAAYDYWCLSRLAEATGHPHEAREYLRRAYDYRKLWKADTRFFHPRDARGQFIEPFSYEFSGGLGARDYYDENNAYTYRFDVQHNPQDLMQLMGGAEGLIQTLDETFRTPISEAKFNFYHQLPDQTGNVGQFSMANEPSLHIPYLYNYAGAPWRTQKVIRKLIGEWFRDDLMGMPGDEDGGGMSGFIVFSMMGFYPVTPGSTQYQIGTPFFPEVTLHLDGERSFTIKASGVSKQNKYIQSARLNGHVFNRPYLLHRELIEGGTLELEMGPRPNKEWGVVEIPSTIAPLEE